MSFVEIKLEDWDCSKVKVGKPPKGGNPTILYDDKGVWKMPILNCAGNNSQKYVLHSNKGLQKNMKYDQNTKKFLDIWEGDWSVSFRVCQSVDSATALEKKLLDIFTDICTKAKAAFKEEPANPISYKYITEKNEFGVEEVKGIDTTKGAYIKVKVGYDSADDAKTFSKDGKDVPVLEERYPKAKFYDITKAKGDMILKNADKEAATGMNAVPKFMIGLFKAGKDAKLYVTKKMMQCYFEPVTSGGAIDDNDLIEMLRADMDLGSE